MHSLSPNTLLEDDDAVQALLSAGRREHTGAHRRPAVKKRNDHVRRDEIVQHVENASDHLGAESVFNPTFSSSFWERQWILEFLGPYYDDKLITDVLRLVKGGKEATVYCCAAHPSTGLDLLAAKVYRPRIFRHLRNDSRYRQGRALLDDRGKVVRDEKLINAARKKTRIGQELTHNSWLEHEFQSLKLLHAAGADVPRPLAHGNSTILMDYIGEEGLPAPALQAVRLPKDEIRPLFDRLLHNIELMLSLGRIHGDLSAYNVLYWEGAAWLIDFPQVVTPSENEEAYSILERDVVRICQYFGRYGLRFDGRQIARGLWERYGVIRPLPVDLLAESEGLP